MSRSILIYEAAEAEINEAADFYDMECPGLGTKFIIRILAVAHQKRRPFYWRGRR